jgi:hypothetical protein
MPTIEERVRHLETCYKNLLVVQEDEAEGVLADMEALIEMNKQLIKYIQNGIEFGYIDDRESEYKKFF